MLQHVLIIYQEDNGRPCPDGLMAAAIVVRWCIQELLDFTLMGDTYQDVNEYPQLPDFQVPENVTHIIAAGFSYPLQWLQHWESIGLSVRTIDHIAPFGEFDFKGVVVDPQESGASLTWMTLFPDQDLPLILKYVREWHHYQMGLLDDISPETEPINAAIGAKREPALRQKTPEGIMYALGLAEGVMDYGRSQVDRLKRSGREIIERRDALIEELLNQAEITELDGHIAARLEIQDEAIPYDERLTELLYQHHPQIELSWLVAPDGMNYLRSVSNNRQPICNVEEIAQARGGEGSLAAAVWEALGNPIKDTLADYSNLGPSVSPNYPYQYSQQRCDVLAVLVVFIIYLAAIVLLRLPHLG